ncbi:FAD-binding protein [Sphingomonas azotifigens]|uniref:FAD-binding protein n=1 Tax=Sphingomonas azotifigens TaxID=330920 RepID=UPI0009FBF721|nr:FAD-binding protein [Sphingomonas azotifigens]
MNQVQPDSAEQLCDAIADAKRDGVRVEIRGGGSKARIGAPREARIVRTTGLSGVVAYDPAELVLTVRAGTPLAEVEALVAAERQMLAFEPFDHGPLFGAPAGAATIGGVIAAGVAGSGRVTAGSARDHLLGFTAVSGRSEVFVAGGKVVKNVTGFDLSKLVTGSWGRLVALTELTLKVLPRPRVSATLRLDGLGPAASCTAMMRALGSHAEVSAAARHPDGPTLFRVAGFEPSVVARCALLSQMLREFGPLQRLEEDMANALWRQAGTGSDLDGAMLWCIHVGPRRAPEVAARLASHARRVALDWGGGRIWASLDDPVVPVRSIARAAGGEALLLRAPDAVRATIPAQHPRAPGVAALEARVRRAFDPDGVFETGRFLDEEPAHAD